jgi:shikimate kinase
MPGVGKSTVGILLAKALKYQFIDTDVLIQVDQKTGLQNIIDTQGLDEFCRLEEKYITELQAENCVIATGGSAVYSPAAMKHLVSSSLIVHLDLELGSIKKRINNLSIRGVVMEKLQTLDKLYEKRQPLYKKYAQLAISCSGKNQDQIVTEIIANIQKDH